MKEVVSRSCLSAEDVFLCDFVILNEDLLSNSVVVSASTKILSSKILIDELFASLCDKVPVGNHRYVEEHVSAVD